MTEIFAGASSKVREAGGTLAGGHTINDPEPKYGLAVIGAAHPDHLLRKGGARPGDRLVLTKRLGTGVLVSGSRQGRTREADLAAAIDGMRALNRAAADAIVATGICAATDITGFGLLGHGLEMARASGARFVFEAAAVPTLAGARDLAAAGIETGGAAHNRRFVAGSLEMGADVPADLVTLAHDPQTSGGMLAAVGPDRVDPLERAFETAGVERWWIGEVASGDPGSAWSDEVRPLERPVLRRGTMEGRETRHRGLTARGGHMRRFIVEVVIDTVLLAVIVLFLGIVSVPQPFPFGTGSAQIVALRGAGIVGFASWAAVLVLINRFARPVLVALTGRLLFSTMGLFVVIINAIAIWLTSVIAPIKIGVVAEPAYLWIIVAAALYTALSTVAGAVLGLNRPDLGADRSRGIWGFLERLPTPRRNTIIENLRLQQVYNAIYTTGLDIALADTPIGPIRRWFAQRVLGETDEFTDAGGPARIRAMLQQLGPTYVKIGQMMASRSDILPTRVDRRAVQAPERGRAVRLRGRRRSSSPRSSVRRRRRSTRPSTRSRSPPRPRPRSTRPGSTTGRSSRSRSSDRGSWPRRRRTSGSCSSWRGSPSNGSASPARSACGRSSPSSPRASSRSSTTATRHTTLGASPTGCSASRRSTSRSSRTSCPASESSPWSSSTASRSRRPTSSAPPASTPPSSAPCSSARSSSRS